MRLMLSSPSCILALSTPIDLEADAVEADASGRGETAGEELGLGFGADDGDMGALLHRRRR